MLLNPDQHIIYLVKKLRKGLADGIQIIRSSKGTVVSEIHAGINLNAGRKVMYGGVHFSKQLNCAAVLVKEKAVSIAHILLCIVDLLLDLCFQAVIEGDDCAFCLSLFFGHTALIGGSQLIECALNHSKEHTLPETLRCGTPHLIIQVVCFIHDKQISGGVNQPFLTAPEFHDMLG